MFLIGVFRAPCVNTVVPWAQEAEDEEEEASDDERIYDGGVDGALLNLQNLSSVFMQHVGKAQLSLTHRG